MAIFARLTDLLKANINDLIDRAEDPEKMVKQIIIDMEEQLQKAVQGLGTVMASQRQMAKKLAEAQSESKLWEDRAKSALKEGNEELARQAVDHKLKADSSVETHEKMNNELSSQVDILRQQVDLLKAKLNEARSLLFSSSTNSTPGMLPIISRGSSYTPEFLPKSQGS